MILSNISVPLLGLVDTAVIGHLDNSAFLAGVALGSMLISIAFWLAGFLRMSTTGLIAQAYGANDVKRQMQILKQGLVIAVVLGILLILLLPMFRLLITEFFKASPDAIEYAQSYVAIRLFSAPAALMNLVLLGWMLGMQFSKGPFYLVLVTNITNIILDIIFVVVFQWQVEGAALASAISDYLSLFFALYLANHVAKQHGYSLKLSFAMPLSNVSALLRANGNIFFRSLCLQLCFGFMTYYGGVMGDHYLAANAVLLNFLMLVSFALDGIAYAAESKVGHACGQKNVREIHSWVWVSACWGMIFAVIYSVFFSVFGASLIALLTDIPEVRSTATLYLPWLIVLPIFASMSFIFDGVFVGLMKTKAMRDSMAISALVGFAAVFYTFKEHGNDALWAAMSSFMLLRGITLMVVYACLYRQDRLLK
ncbi:MATE family efflux transporter [Pseudoalteromonas ulvae]|uniref:MATE family efflux transporter n=1 Tax=Pseudoalteromonas ulvae TaxID=107327 RepID=UPI00186B90FB|nr:MATE family efflux transporter [Pseudoalteromonas ulvae]